MNAGLYVLVGCSIGVLFGAILDIEDGDYMRTISAILACALWPFSIALGFGAFLGDVIRGLRRKAA